MELRVSFAGGPSDQFVESNVPLGLLVTARFQHSRFECIRIENSKKLGFCLRVLGLILVGVLYKLLEESGYLVGAELAAQLYTHVGFQETYCIFMNNHSLVLGLLPVRPLTSEVTRMQLLKRALLVQDI